MGKRSSSTATAASSFASRMSRGSHSPARGIDLLLEAPQALQTQLAAIVEAGGDTNLRILVPMVTSAEQMQTVRGLLNAVLDGRRAQLGAMIETPEAAAAAQAISGVAD